MNLLEASEAKYRALVTDINLGPGKLDGWDIARHAREIDPNFPVVYMSGKLARLRTARERPLVAQNGPSTKTVASNRGFSTVKGSRL